MLGMTKSDDGKISLIEDGKHVLAEEDLTRMDSDSLLALRRQFVDAKADLVAAQSKLGDADRYGSAKGVKISQDLGYCNSVLWRLEAEMAGRMIPLA